MKTATATAPDTATGGDVCSLNLDLCIPNPQNEKRPVDEEFLKSLREKGQQVIALVRPHPERDGFYDIIDGERRQEGLWAIGQRAWRAEVREMSDQEADELRAILNAQRRGLGWQQTCNLIAGYLERHQDEDAPARIGSAIGITSAQVKRRARMLFQLAPVWLDALKSGGLPAWTVDHFEVLTVFDVKFQDSFYKQVHYNANGLTVLDLKEYISSDSKTLKGAPWDLDDVTLVPKAGACDGCTTRSDSQADLFGEAAGVKTKDASCLNSDCFAKKMQAHANRKAAQLLEKHPEAIKVATDWNAGGKGVLKSHEFSTAKKGDKGAVAAIQYGDNGKVSLGYVKVRKSAEAKDASPKARAKEAEMQRQTRIDALAIEKLQAAIQDPDTEFHEDAYPLLVQFCLVHGEGLEVDSEEEMEKRVRAFSKRPIKIEELWAVASEALVRHLDAQQWQLERGSAAEDNAVVMFAAWMVDADFHALRKEAEAELAAPSAQGGEAEKEDDELWESVSVSDDDAD